MTWSAVSQNSFSAWYCAGLQSLITIKISNITITISKITCTLVGGDLIAVGYVYISTGAMCTSKSTVSSIEGPPLGPPIRGPQGFQYGGLQFNEIWEILNMRGILSSTTPPGPPAENHLFQPVVLGVGWGPTIGALLRISQIFVLRKFRIAGQREKQAAMPLRRSSPEHRAGRISSIGDGG